MVIQPTRKGSTMKLFAFILLTVIGLVAGMVIGLSSMPPYQWRHQEHLTGNAIGGTVAGMIAGGIAAWIAGGSKDKKKD